MDYDVIVVGAGPAGSTAAYELALLGAKVKLVEQRRIPRYKPCGGCLSLKIDGILEPDFHAVVETTVYGATFTFHGLDEFRVKCERPVAYMVMRDRFDYLLTEKARNAGTEVSPGERVVDVSETADCVRVKSDLGEYRAQYLVAADGANGIVARQLSLIPKRRVAVCVEAEVETEPGEAEPPRDEVRIELGSIPFGYGWVFPKGDHLSIGVGGQREKVGNPRAFYDEFLVDQDLVDAIRSEKRRGDIIPIFAGGREPLGSERTLLVGDAAALVDPFLGEGIYYAVRSGQLAARVINTALSNGHSAIVREYTHQVEAEIYREFRPARTMAVFLHAFPRAGFQILKQHRAVTELYFDIMRGEASYADFWRNFRGHAAARLVRSLWMRPRKARDVAEHYDRLSRQYDSALSVWRTLVAAPAWEAVAELLEKYVPRGGAVLDAGTGTGEAVRLLLERSNPERVVAVDVSRGMLRGARKKIADPRVSWEQQDITRLPYADRSFDVVVSTWTLETLADPRAAVSELLRVLKDDGYLIYSFSSRATAGLENLYGRLLEGWSAGALRGRFLRVDERPYHSCKHSTLNTYARGLATVVVLRKCCSVDDPAAPCLPFTTEVPAGR